MASLTVSRQAAGKAIFRKRREDSVLVPMCDFVSGEAIPLGFARVPFLG
jgi:hypothetical protein